MTVLKRGARECYGPQALSCGFIPKAVCASQAVHVRMFPRRPEIDSSRPRSVERSATILTLVAKAWA